MVVVETVNEVIDPSGKVSAQFLNSCGTFPSRIVTYQVEPPDISRLVHAMLDIWVSEVLEQRTKHNQMTEFSLIATGPEWADLLRTSTPP